MSTKTKRNQDVLFQTVYDTAQLRGRDAAEQCMPTPMVVQEHANQLDDSSPVRKQWVVPDGVCGFAWVTIKPGTSAFARWLKQTNRARTDYYGGVFIWISQYNQSMQRKEAHAEAMAEYLRSVGIKAHAHSRMD